jgi:hypothetical protein
MGVGEGDEAALAALQCDGDTGGGVGHARQLGIGLCLAVRELGMGTATAWSSKAGAWCSLHVGLSPFDRHRGK